MDPNATLEEIRAIIRDSMDLDFNRFLELVEELDDWMSNGGFLPDAWRHK